MIVGKIGTVLVTLTALLAVAGTPAYASINVDDLLVDPDVVEEIGVTLKPDTAFNPSSLSSCRTISDAEKRADDQVQSFAYQFGRGGDGVTLLDDSARVFGKTRDAKKFVEAFQGKTAEDCLYAAFKPANREFSAKIHVRHSKVDIAKADTSVAITVDATYTKLGALPIDADGQRLVVRRGAVVFDIFYEAPTKFFDDGLSKIKRGLTGQVSQLD